MSSKKKEKLVIERLPYDCWCHIIKFFSDHKNLLNLVKAISGLWNHVKTICPHCTLHIKYKVIGNRYPSSSQNLVQKLSISSRNTDFDGLDFLGDENPVNILSRLSSLFPNLKDLYASFGDVPFGDSFGYRHDVFMAHSSSQPTKILRIQLSILNPFQNLKILTLSICGRDTTLQSKFPNLQVLNLIDKRFSCFPYHDLSFDWKDFPRLISLQLIGWKLRTKFDCTSNPLEELRLCDTEVGDFKSVSHFPKLKSLFLGLSTISFVENICDLPELRTLELSSDFTKMSEIVCDDFSFETNLSISNLPKVETISIRVGKVVGLSGGLNFFDTQNEGIFWGNRGALYLDRFTELREFICEGVKFDVILSNTPKLEHLCLLRCSGWIRLQSSLDGLNLRKIVWKESRFDYSFWKEQISYFKKLKTIILKEKLVADFSLTPRYDRTNSKEIGFEGFSDLEFIKTSDLQIGKIHDSPKLKEVWCEPGSNFSFSKVPELRVVHLDLRDSPLGFENCVFEQFYELESVEKVELKNVNYFSNKVHVSLNPQNLRHVKSLGLNYCLNINFEGRGLTNIRKIDLNHCKGSIVFKDHQNLETISCNNFNGECFRIENCSNLSLVRMNVGSSILVKHGLSAMKKLYFELKNLEKCETMHISGRIDRISRFLIDRTVPVKQLILKREFLFTGGTESGFQWGRETKAEVSEVEEVEFSITNENFPFLETLVLEKLIHPTDEAIRFGKLGNRFEVWQITKMENLKNLKWIELREDNMELGSYQVRKPFVEGVEGLDLDSIEVKVFSQSRLIVIQTFREYILENSDIVEILQKDDNAET